MKSRSQKRKEKKEKLAKTGRVIRLKKRLTRIHKKKCADQQDSHMTAIMESYILKRKAERKAAKEKEAAANPPPAAPTPKVQKKPAQSNAQSRMRKAQDNARAGVRSLY